MAQVPTAVSVVTTQARGRHHGTTVSAFLSLSTNPPTLLVSLENTSLLLSQLGRDALIGINVLSDRQGDVAAQFARTDKDMDALTAAWDASDGQPAQLPGCLAWFCVRVSELVPAGDHTLVIGTVVEADARPGAPLVYWRRTYGTHTAA
jgi:flavin reductase (DIM6/NTAB) family NADH-FMN oxidoreductase RutF